MRTVSPAQLTWETGKERERERERERVSVCVCTIHIGMIKYVCMYVCMHACMCIHIHGTESLQSFTADSRMSDRGDKRIHDS